MDRSGSPGIPACCCQFTAVVASAIVLAFATAVADSCSFGPIATVAVIKASLIFNLGCFQR